MTNHPAHELDTTVAIEFRNELLARDWPDDRRVARLTGNTTGPEGATYAIQARASGVLLGLWSERLRGFVYPDFQFDHVGAIRKYIPELLAVLPRDNDHGGWRRTFWLYSPHVLLDGQTPADVFSDAPTRVVAIAQDEFWSDPDTTW